jgi:D-arabinose 1-dehydrogenase-like Zn-dependent alcohol dehydrogenase
VARARALQKSARAIPYLLCGLAEAVNAMNQQNTTSRRELNVAVIGAGAFGGWMALHLLREGTKVILLDVWGPGNSRASSGEDTRVIRGAYGGDADYIEWVARSFVL